MNVAYKILLYIILDNIKLLAEKILKDYKDGFRSIRSTTDQILSLR